MAMVLSLFFVMLFGILELSIAVFRYHAVGHLSRQIARMAIVRGEMAIAAPMGLGRWGPGTYGPQVLGESSGADPIASTTSRYLAGLDPDRTTVQIEWPEGSNRLEMPVRVTVETAYEPFITFLFTSTWTLRGVSTMSIAH
jgi:hypothetical protein